MKAASGVVQIQKALETTYNSKDILPKNNVKVDLSEIKNIDKVKQSALSPITFSRQYTA
jgi:hypothetical protein